MFVCLFIDPWGTRPSPSWRPVFLTFWAYALNGLSLFRHEYCNFTCMVSYHLDFHQLDLGSFTGLQYCWHPVFNEPKLDTSIYSLMWRTRTTWRHNLHARDNALSILSGSPIAVLTALDGSLTAVIWREPLSLPCHVVLKIFNKNSLRIIDNLITYRN